MERIFTEKIKGFDLYPHNSLDHDVKNLLILNLNYTKTIMPYYKELTYYIPNTGILNLHGQLKQFKNPIIFGYGDELDESYKEMEKRNENELFKYSKSFKYLQTSNYRKLINFVDSSDFQVVTLGHSIGLSDRTMLNYIFENKKCRSIKIFYHEEREDYIQKTYEASRHFNDKAKMRNLIVSYDNSSPLPQAGSTLKNEV